MKRIWISLFFAVTVFSQHAHAQLWMQKRIQTSPSGRVGHAMAYDPIRGQAVLFGGNAGGTLPSDTWLWNGTNWFLQASSGPAGRTFSAMAFDRPQERIIMFGGSGNVGTMLQDTWAWNGASWSRLNPVLSPSPRFHHAMASDPFRGQIVLFGGSDGVNALNDTWIWQGTTWLPAAPANIPRASANVLMAYDQANQEIMLYDELFRETWLWNGSDWFLQTSTNAPPARQAGTMATISFTSQIVLFGGIDPADGRLLNDTWIWDGTNWTKSPAPLAPSPRAGSAATSAATGGVVLFGGQDPVSISPETWISAPLQFLGFPLTDLTPYTANINAVMDHDVDLANGGRVAFYASNGSVVAYTSDKGTSQCGLIECTETSSSVNGYKNTLGTSFAGSLLNYTGGGFDCKDENQRTVSCEFWLFYDGHPGYDYHAPLGTYVFAPADGIAFIPDCDPVTRRNDCDPKAAGSAVDGFNILAIDHGNGYSTWYLHLGDLETATDEVESVSSDTFRITVLHSGLNTFQANKSVVYAGTGKTLRKVDSNPDPGQYVVDNTGVYVFNAADAGQSVKITYVYQAADFRVIECPGQPPVALHRGDGQHIPVTTQCKIAQSGNKAVHLDNTPSILGPHLHFEVRKGMVQLPSGAYQCLPPACEPVDPYGWNGGPDVPDPYPAGPNVLLWQTPVPVFLVKSHGLNRDLSTMAHRSTRLWRNQRPGLIARTGPTTLGELMSVRETTQIRHISHALLLQAPAQ